MKTVILLGPPGSFSHNVGSRLKFKIVSAKSFAEIFQKVMKGNVDYGLIPVKNSLTGKIYEAKQLFVKWRRFIIKKKSIIHPIALHLAASKKQLLHQIKILYVSPYVIRPCKRFLKKYLPHVVLKNVASTSLSLKKALHRQKAAAIGSLEGIKRYGLNILAKNIHHPKKNFTTFLLFSKRRGQTKLLRAGRVHGKSRRKTRDPGR